MNNSINFSDRYIPNKLDRLNRLKFKPFFPILKKYCKIKMLVVTDSIGTYGNGSFGLSDFLKAFDSPLPYTSFDITRAHRESNNTGDISNFTFDSHNLDQYDVIFIFAVRSQQASNISESELRAITEYMDNGGGMFATGDHADLGVSICGQIPRVKSMRRWYTPSNPGPNNEPFAPLASVNNLDTNVDVMGAGGSDTDYYPQTIRPKYKYRYVFPGFNNHHIWNYVKYPHPVLCCPDGVINKLPDHMHEGLCEVPSDLTWSSSFSGYNFEEYPMVSGSRIKPEILAWATNHNPNAPSSFGVIGALDGHKHATLGRVIVDATWHHFFDINISQYEILKDDVNNGHIPTVQEQAALKAYNLIQHYYRNIAYWCARRSKQKCFRLRGWRWLIRHHDIIMNLDTSLRRKSKFERFEYFHSLGVIATNALGDLQSQCQSSAFLWSNDWVFERKQFELNDKLKGFSFVDPRVFETVCLGCTLHNISEALDKNNDQLSDKQINNIIQKSSLESSDFVLKLMTNSLSRFKKKQKKYKASLK